MLRSRKGFTLGQLLLALVLVVLIVGGVILWQRVAKLNSWAVAHNAWVKNDLYPWIKNNAFSAGGSGGNPDGTKPPPPPDGL